MSAHDLVLLVFAFPQLWKYREAACFFFFNLGVLGGKMKPTSVVL